jgi:hypothetical protein
LLFGSLSEELLDKILFENWYETKIVINCNSNNQDIKTCTSVKIVIKTNAVFLALFPKAAAI